MQGKSGDPGQRRPCSQAGRDRKQQSSGRDALPGKRAMSETLKLKVTKFMWSREDKEAPCRAREEGCLLWQPSCRCYPAGRDHSHLGVDASRAHAKHAGTGLGPDYTSSSPLGEKRNTTAAARQCQLAKRASPTQHLLAVMAYVEHAAIWAAPTPPSY